MQGQILWGDGAEQDYSVDASHPYEEEGSHEVVLKMQHANETQVPSLGIKRNAFAHPKEAEKK